MLNIQVVVALLFLNLAAAIAVRFFRERRLLTVLVPNLNRMASDLSPRGFEVRTLLIRAQGPRCLGCGSDPYPPVLQQAFIPVEDRILCLPFMLCRECAQRVQENPEGRNRLRERITKRLEKLIATIKTSESFFDRLPESAKAELMDAVTRAFASGDAIYVAWLASHLDSCNNCGRPFDDKSTRVLGTLKVKDGLVMHYGHSKVDLIVPVIVCEECEQMDSHLLVDALAPRIREFLDSEEAVAAFD